MSIKLTTQDAWKHYAHYSKYHPDNTNRPPFVLGEDKVEKPEPLVSFSEAEKLDGAWGHKLCCEQITGPQDSNMRMMKRGITPKVRRIGPATVQSLTVCVWCTGRAEVGWAGRFRGESAVAHVHRHVRSPRLVQLPAAPAAHGRASSQVRGLVDRAVLLRDDRARRAIV